MNIAFLTTDESFYLPAMFDYLFNELSANHKLHGIVVPPVYKGTTKAKLAVRYFRTFGFYEGVRLSAKVIFYKLFDKFHLNRRGRYFSLPSTFKKHEIPFAFENDVNSVQNHDRLKNLEIDLLISISCPQLFKSDLISLPPKGCLNLHGAILPHYRGVMPSFWMLANNEKVGGLTLFYVNKKIDAGDVLIQRKYDIMSDETLDSIIKKSKKIGAEMIVEAVQKIESGQVNVTPLEIEGGSYYGWPSKDDVLTFRNNGRSFR